MQWQQDARRSLMLHKHNSPAWLCSGLKISHAATQLRVGSAARYTRCVIFKLHGLVASMFCRPGSSSLAVRAAAHLRGGSAAGYARWAAFKLHELNAYSAARNNFMHRNGVSRLSAYHHWGMVSLWRIARETKTAGAPWVPCAGVFGHCAGREALHVLRWRSPADHNCTCSLI